MGHQCSRSKYPADSAEFKAKTQDYCNTFKLLMRKGKLTLKDIASFYNLFHKIKDRVEDEFILLSKLLHFIGVDESNNFFSKLFCLFSNPVKDETRNVVNFRQFVFLIWTFGCLDLKFLSSLTFDFYVHEITKVIDKHGMNRLIKDVYGSLYKYDICALRIIQLLEESAEKISFNKKKFIDFVMSNPAIFHPIEEVRLKFTKQVFGLKVWRKYIVGRGLILDEELLQYSKYNLAYFFELEKQERLEAVKAKNLSHNLSIQSNSSNISGDKSMSGDAFQSPPKAVASMDKLENSRSLSASPTGGVTIIKPLRSAGLSTPQLTFQTDSGNPLSDEVMEHIVGTKPIKSKKPNKRLKRSGGSHSKKSHMGSGDVMSFDDVTAADVTGTDGTNERNMDAAVSQDVESPTSTSTSTSTFGLFGVSSHIYKVLNFYRGKGPASPSVKPTLTSGDIYKDPSLTSKRKYEVSDMSPIMKSESNAIISLQDTGGFTSTTGKIFKNNQSKLSPSSRNSRSPKGNQSKDTQLVVVDTIVHDLEAED